VKKGDKAKLKRNTFLFNGIFVHYNSTVEIGEIKDDTIDIIYNDKEGFPHIISNIKPSELEIL
jgi:hypothetical protein